MFSACRNCPRSAIQAQDLGSTRSLLRTLCTTFTLAFFTGSKKAWDWMSNGSLQSHSLAAFSFRGGQSVITHFCVDNLSEQQISLVGELSSAISLILKRRAGNSHSAETSETDSGHGHLADWIRLSTKKEETLFKKRLYSIHLQCKNMIYLLTLFWNNFLNLTFFLVIKQIANCRSYWVTNNGRCWFA